MILQSYKYEISCKEYALIGKPVTEDEIDKVVQFAKEKTISEYNYKMMFGLEGDAGFPKMGALIETSEEDVYAVVNHPEQYFSVGLWNEQKQLLAFLFIQLEDLDGFLVQRENIRFRKGQEGKWNQWMKYIEGGQMAFKGDLAINSLLGYSKLFLILYYISIQELLKRGKKMCVTEVFHVLSCIDQEGVHDINLFNEQSFLAQVMGGGAEYVGDTKNIRKKIGKQVEVLYYAKLLEYKFPLLFQLCQREIDKEDIHICLLS